MPTKAEEIEVSLAEARVEPERLFGVVYATGKYGPTWEAVLILQQEGCLTTVTIVGHRRSEVVESASWTPVNS